MHRSSSRWLPVCFLGVAGLILGATASQAGGGKKDGDAKTEKPAGKPLLAVDGELTDKDARDPKEAECYCKTFPIKLQEGRSYQIDLVSKDFDAFLRLEDADGKAVAEDDDGGGDLNARIVHKATKSGDYKIFATTFAKNATGKFQLTVTSPDATGDKVVDKTPAPPAKAIPLKFESGKGLPSVQVAGQLATTDSADKGKLFKVYVITLESGKLYRIYLKGGKGLDAFLRVEDEAGKFLDEDKFGDVPADSAVEFTPPKTAPYRIVATSYKAGMTGDFTLSIAEQAVKPGTPPVTPAQAVAPPSPGVTVGKSSRVEAMPAFHPVMRTEIVGQLAPGDSTDKEGKAFKVYTFTAKANLLYIVKMHGRTFEALVRLEDAKGVPIKKEDFFDGRFSQLVLTPGKGGTYRVVASAAAPNLFGSFTLAITEHDAKPPVQQPVVFDRASRIADRLTLHDGIDNEGKFVKVYVIKRSRGSPTTAR